MGPFNFLIMAIQFIQGPGHSPCLVFPVPVFDDCVKILEKIEKDTHITFAANIGLTVHEQWNRARQFSCMLVSQFGVISFFRIYSVDYDNYKMCLCTYDQLDFGTKETKFFSDLDKLILKHQNNA
jgi:hypothetical protein